MEPMTLAVGLALLMMVAFVVLGPWLLLTHPIGWVACVALGVVIVGAFRTTS